MHINGLLGPRERSHHMQNSTFCVCPPGDYPYTLRLFQAILNLCVPVVFTFESHVSGLRSWYKHNGSTAEDSLPFPWMIDYEKAVIEIPFGSVPQGATSHPQTAPPLNGEWFPVGDLLKQVPEKVAYLASIRHLLNYEMASSGKEDAFSGIINGIEKAVQSLGEAEPI